MWQGSLDARVGGSKVLLHEDDNDEDDSKEDDSEFSDENGCHVCSILIY